MRTIIVWMFMLYTLIVSIIASTISSASMCWTNLISTPTAFKLCLMIAASDITLAHRGNLLNLVRSDNLLNFRELDDDGRRNVLMFRLIWINLNHNFIDCHSGLILLLFLVLWTRRSFRLRLWFGFFCYLSTSLLLKRLPRRLIKFFLLRSLNLIAWHLTC